MGMTTNGPRAPKDPTKKRPAVYVMLDDIIEGTPRENGQFEEVCFLEGRVEAKIKAIAPDMPQEIAAALQTCRGLRKYVHSIGITATAQDNKLLSEKLCFHLQCRTEVGYDGTHFEAEIPCNGQEVLIFLSDYPEHVADTVLASFRMVFSQYMTAKMTICFYLEYEYQVPEIMPDQPVDFSSEAYRRMIDASLIQQGNLYRLKKAIAKAREGREVTIAYIGGSITQGAGAKPISTASYAYRSCQAFRDRFALDGSKVHFVKAGVGGTPSQLGLHRYEREILQMGRVEPDIVVIEFSVNDAGDETSGVCYESLALMAAKGAGHPAVILLHSVFMDDGNLQERLEPVGRCYEFPQISLKNAVTAQFYQEKPVLTKRQYFYDLYHPSNTGHRIMADCLDALWKRADEYEGELKETDYNGKKPAIGNTYQYMKSFTRNEAFFHVAVKEIQPGSFHNLDFELQMVERDDHSRATPEFADNWMHIGGENGESFQMKIVCKDLMIVYKDSGDQKFGRAEVKVDGRIARIIDPLEIGWNHCNAYIIHNGAAAEEHHVEISCIPEDGSKCFTILGFGYTVE